MSHPQSTQWWIISAGEDPVREKVWNEFRNSNTVGFYWNETGDLSKLNDEKIKEKFKQIGIKEKGKPRFWDPARAILMVKKKDLEIDREQLFFIVVVNTFYDTFRRVPTGKLWLSKHCFYCAMQTFCSMTRRVWHSKRQ